MPVKGARVVSLQDEVAKGGLRHLCEGGKGFYRKQKGEGGERVVSKNSQQN